MTSRTCRPEILLCNYYGYVIDVGCHGSVCTNNSLTRKPMEGDDLQEVVMERDGRFELLSAVDLQAEQAEGVEQLQTNERTEVAGTEDGENDIIQHTALQDHEHGTTGDRTDAKPKHPLTPTDQQAGDAKPSKEREHALDEDKNKTSNFDQPHLLETNSDPAVSDVPTTSAEVASESSKPATTLTQPPLSNDNNPVDRKDSSPSQIPLNIAKNKEKERQIRTKSAPASRSALKRVEEEREKRKQLSDAAFTAWLSKKQTEVIAKRREERERLSYTAEDLQKKKEQCDVVYQNWLEAKNKQWKSERARERSSRPSTSVPKRDEERCRQAFETWMKRKETQYLEEKKKEQIRSQELEDAAKRADPSVVEKAYKGYELAPYMFPALNGSWSFMCIHVCICFHRWLVRKKEQAKEEASRKEHYRKLYFSQPGQLKKHTTER